MKIKILKTWSRWHGKARAAFTLAELLIAFTISVVVVGGVAVILVYTEMTYCQVSNYTSMINQSRTALDVFSKDIRNASALMAFGSLISICQTILWHPRWREVKVFFDF